MSRRVCPPIGSLGEVHTPEFEVEDGLDSERVSRVEDHVRLQRPLQLLSSLAQQRRLLLLSNQRLLPRLPVEPVARLQQIASGAQALQPLSRTPPPPPLP